MYDPYVDENGVLLNKRNIKNKEILEEYEGIVSLIKIKLMTKNVLKGDFNFKHLCKIHNYIFNDVYEFAGNPRTIPIYKNEKILGTGSVEYSEHKEIKKNANRILSKANKLNWKNLSSNELVVQFSKFMADIWKVHPFREGNTRTTTIFCCDFINARGININREVFSSNAKKFRDSLVLYSLYTKTYNYQETEHLEALVKKAFDSVIEKKIENVEEKTEYYYIANEKALQSFKNVLNDINYLQDPVNFENKKYNQIIEKFESHKINMNRLDNIKNLIEESIKNYENIIETKNKDTKIIDTGEEMEL